MLVATDQTCADGHRAVEGVGRGDDPGDRRALLRRQARTPDVADQDVARLVAVVPGFVLDRVVEDPGFAHAPLARLAADAEAAAWRHDERQMHDQPEVCDARVRRDARLRRERRVHRAGRTQRDFRLRQPRHGRDRRRRAAAAVLDRLAVVVEVVGAPARRMVEPAPLVERHVLGVVDVGREARLRPPARCRRAPGRWPRSRLRTSGKPGELAALVELDRRQSRVVVLGRLLTVASADPQRRVDEGVDAATFRRACSALGVGEPGCGCGRRAGACTRRARDARAGRPAESGASSASSGGALASAAP